jgi:hypothetical protein
MPSATDHRSVSFQTANPAVPLRVRPPVRPLARTLSLFTGDEVLLLSCP